VDWSRAKTLLIVMFLGANAFLGYQLWIQENSNGLPGTVDPGLMPDVEAALEDVGINLKAPIPAMRPYLKLLLLRYESPDRLHLVRALLENPPLQVTPDVQEYEDESGKVIFSTQGSVRYFRQGGGDSPDIDREAAIQLGEVLAREHGLLPVDARFDYHRVVDGVHRLYYSQYYQDYGLFGGGGIMVRVDSRGIAEYIRVWYQPLGWTGKPRQVISTVEAIISNVSRLPQAAGEKESRLVGIELGYFTGMYDAAKWEAAPVWRLRFSTGGVALINAYTGEMEWPP